MNEREEFEKIVEDSNELTPGFMKNNRDGNGYYVSHFNQMWLGWQARAACKVDVRAAVIELVLQTGGHTVTIRHDTGEISEGVRVRSSTVNVNELLRAAMGESHE